jgi:hypothetical protein
MMSLMRGAAACATALGLTGCGSGSAVEPMGPPSFSGAPLESVMTDSGRLHVDVRWFPSPPIRGNDAAQLTVVDDSGAPVDGLQVTIVPWMPAHGHGTSVTPVVTAIGPGTLQASPVYLFMAGEWQLRMTLSGTSDDTAMAIVEIP